MKQIMSLSQKFEILTQTRKPKEEEELWNNTNKVLYGPVASRRLGESIGINLFPGKKVCSYNCVYCDVGLTNYNEKVCLKSDELCEMFLNNLENIKEKYDRKEIKIDYFTFCGNGENLDHPEFERIYFFIKNKINEYFPRHPFAILTNGHSLSLNRNIDIVNEIDVNFVKLDAGDEKTFYRINRPIVKNSWNNLLENLKLIKNLRIETAIVSSQEYNNLESLYSSYIDLINYFESIGNLNSIYLHNIDYPTPDDSIKYYSKEELIEIGERISRSINVPIYLLHSQVNFRERG